jgi:hypothetical protein
MADTIVDVGTISTEIVLSERKVTNEFVITQIVENVRNRSVRVDLELGPFTEEIRPNGEVDRRGSGSRSVDVWQNEAYDAIRDVWRNEDLIAAVKLNLS